MQTTAASADALYILGDFFEVWIGDDDDSPFNHSIIRILRDYRDNGGLLYFMVGNRDFLIGEGFAKQTGAQLLTDPTVIDLYGKKVLLMHGDSLCTLDTEYMAFRQQARSEPWQSQLLSQPLEVRRQIAKDLREQSQSMNSLKADDIMDVTPEEVDRSMSDHGVNLMIHGHTHRPARHSLDDGNRERIVLGDWHEDAWWLIAEPTGSISLESAPIKPR